jgi:hypothetical protein
MRSIRVLPESSANMKVFAIVLVAFVVAQVYKKVKPFFQITFLISKNWIHLILGGCQGLVQVPTPFGLVPPCTDQEHQLVCPPQTFTNR